MLDIQKHQERKERHASKKRDQGWERSRDLHHHHPSHHHSCILSTSCGFSSRKVTHLHPLFSVCIFRFYKYMIASTTQIGIKDEEEDRRRGCNISSRFECKKGRHETRDTRSIILLLFISRFLFCCGFFSLLHSSLQKKFLHQKVRP